ncbi:MAG: FAD-dependent oxidoreductase [Syntrophales bacterium]
MQPKELRILLGNEAISRGLIEAGVQFITAYPGTPSTEILPAVIKFKEELGITVYAEWSTNEKVALETALAAAYAGKRAAVAMKQVGLNVAADPALSAAYIGVVGGLVLVVADDPGPNSSQTEQDSRLFAIFAKIPALDPCCPQEAKDLAELAFTLSERYQIPVILRPTMRVCHSRQQIFCGPVKSQFPKASFEKNPGRWAATPKARLKLHHLLNQKLAEIEKEFATWDANKIILPEAANGKILPLGIVACGVSYSYLCDLLEPLGLTDKVGVLKIATAYPLPRAMVDDFASRCSRLLVLEEPDIAVETQIRINKPVWGRLTGHVPAQGELAPEVMEGILTRAASESGLLMAARDLQPIRNAIASLDLSIRRPTLCPGCGHRTSFYAMRRSCPDAIFPGDIGCYTLGLNLGAVDTCHDMGASIAMASGFYHAYAQDGSRPPILATIGDGTFFHSGAAGLENAVFNGARFVLIVMDNSTTGMTGMQPTPEFGITADGHPGRPIELEGLIRGCGVNFISYADPFDLAGFQQALSAAIIHTRLPKGGVAVIIARYACVTQLKGLPPAMKPVKVEVRRGEVERRANGAGVAERWMPRHEDKISPCIEACPAGNDIEKLMALAADGNLRDAARTLYSEHPFPSTLGRVCPHCCETACNRSGYDEPLAIRAIERLAGDFGNAADDLMLQHPDPIGKRVGIVGGGPAGLTAAYHLARMGWEVEVFEAKPEVGGMLRWAIPEYRLPLKVLARELEVFKTLGVKFTTSTVVGKDLSWAELRSFDAICLATGAGRERRLDIPGNGQEGIFRGLDFLGNLRMGVKSDIGHRVAVIGGGNTAIDAARCAKRLGAEVTVYYRRTEQKMRAIPEEIQAARAEGIFFRFQAVPVQVKKGNSRKLSLKFREMQPEETNFPPPFSGQEGAAEFTIEVDAVIEAIGAAPELSYLNDSVKLDNAAIFIDSWGKTSLTGFFAAGDATSRGAGTVAGAVNAGKRAALAIHSQLSGECIPEREVRLVDGVGISMEVTAKGEASSRFARIQAVPLLQTLNLRSFPKIGGRKEARHPPDETIWGFEETKRGLSRDNAAWEARERCFHCGVCTHCDTCLLVCPVGAITKNEGSYSVDSTKCTGCRLCQVECPRNAITMPAAGVCVACGYCTTWFECPALVRDNEGFVEIDRRTCIDCGYCIQVCPQGAIMPMEIVQ